VPIPQVAAVTPAIGLEHPRSGMELVSVHLDDHALIREVGVNLNTTDDDVEQHPREVATAEHVTQRGLEVAARRVMAVDQQPLDPPGGGGVRGPDRDVVELPGVEGVMRTRSWSWRPAARASS
jgi:hypothetical protein